MRLQMAPKARKQSTLQKLNTFIMNYKAPFTREGFFYLFGINTYLFFSGCHQSFILFRANAISCSRTPLYTGRLHFTRHFFPAFLAVRLNLIGPHLIDRITPETLYLFRMWGSNFTASWTTFLKHLSFILLILE